MHLSRTAEYALRAMIRMTILEEGMSISAQELSDATNIPPAYLSKVMRRMVLAGLVTAQRGHGGGFALARPAKEIHFADVLAAVGIDTDDEHCAFGFLECSADSPCALHFAWNGVGKRFHEWARDTSLAAFREQRSLVKIRTRPPA